MAIPTNGQALSALENQHEKLTQESELDRKSKIASSRDVFKLDSTYFYDDFEDNLERKWIYYDYNSANNYAYYEDFSYADMQWTPRFIRNRTFNPDGSVHSYISQRYENGEWLNSARATYEYNQSGYQTLDDREQWNEDLQEWGPNFRFVTTYNDDNTLLTITHYSRDLSGSILELRYVRTYTNVDNVITSWITQNYTNGEVYRTDRTVVFLNADNDRDSTYSYEWNEAASSWDLLSRYIYPADMNAPVRVYQTDLYDEVTDAWDPRFRHIYTDYTNIGEVQYWDRMRSDAGQSEFMLDARLEYFWSGNPLNVNGLTDPEIDILIANPFEGTPEITINGIKKNTTVTIYDMSGKLVFTKALTQPSTFTLNKLLPNGNYIINLRQANKVVGAKKIIKIR